MGICSYCQKEGSLTREHIIPSWYYKYDPSPDDSGFMERAKGKIVNTELKIRDVCNTCNNETLSALDNYGKNLFFSDLEQYVYTDTEHLFKYDYKLFSRWLLKVAYNSARAHKSDIEVLSQYRKVILGEEPFPCGFMLRLRTIAPASGGEYEVFPAAEKDPVVDNPEWFRIGVFRVQNFDSMYWAFRHITINSYCFLLYLPSINNHESTEELPRLVEAIDSEDVITAQLTDSGEVMVPRPEYDSITYSLNHLGQFPLTYELIENGTLKQAIEADFPLVNYWIDRKDIEEKNIGNVLDFLADLVCAREVAMSMKDKIEVSVHGYDDDPRELYEIPEVITFLSKLDEAWPYWILFQHPDFHWLRVLAVCLSQAKKNEEGFVDFNQDLMIKNMERWFVALNELSHEFAISLEVNRAASEKAARLLTGAHT